MDALQDIRKISDTNFNDAYLEIKSKILRLSEDEIKRMLYFSKKRKPRVRALVGSMLEKKYPEMGEALLKTLNSLTTYKLGVDKTLIPNMEKWKIK